MEEKLISVIEKIILRKYPFLYDVEVNDVFKGMNTFSHFVGTTFHCKMKSEKCLSAKEQMEINDEVRSLLKMLSFTHKHQSESPTIQCFFDCGKGYEFQSY